MKLNVACFAVVCVCVALFTLGCESGTGFPTEYVEGIVTLDGSPVEGATVQFSPVGGAAATGGSSGDAKIIAPEAANGMTDKAGKYTLSSISGDFGKGAVKGDYTVLVTKRKSTTLEAGPDGKPLGAAPKDNRGNPVLTTQEDLLPVVYRDWKKSPLKATVVAGKNTINFELKGDAK